MFTPFRAISSLCLSLLLSSISSAHAQTPSPAPAPVSSESGLEFIDTSFENASPLWYEFAPDGSIQIHLNYDHERNSPNRAAGHFHFLLQGKPGSKLTLEFRNLQNIWNRKAGSVAREMKLAFISENGRDWTPAPTESLPDNRIRLNVELRGPKLYVARLEPYRISDLENLIKSISENPNVAVSNIGKTVQGRDLEIIRIGNEKTPHRIFIRARSHPWEPGGNWVVEGLIHRLLQDDTETKKFLERYCLYVMPMANKDGVARGGTRFNLQGKDLNRNWDKPADPALAPENVALEKWLERMIAANQSPDFAIDIHNDGSGLLHLSRPNIPTLDQYIKRMASFESLLRKHTHFTEGATKPSFHNPGTLGDSWVERFGIDAVILEFNCNWIAGINDYPTAKNWKKFGADLAKVFDEYFKAQ